MSVEETIEARHQARLSLVECMRYLRERDMRIRYAAALGITHTEIAHITGMSRQRISAIVNKRGGNEDGIA